MKRRIQQVDSNNVSPTGSVNADIVEWKKKRGEEKGADIANCSGRQDKSIFT